MTNTCLNCKHARSQSASTTDALRQCRRYPPHPVVVLNGKGKREIVSVWPTVPSQYVCGEFERKEGGRYD